jgi:alkylation response protein AidB-like acyl-CoA dehydrogenase
VTSLDAEELSALAAMADAFARAELGPRQAGLEDGDSIDPAIIAAFRAAGLWRLGLPEEAGGEGAGMAATLLVAQRLARVSPAAAMTLVHAQAGGGALLSAGAGDLARAHPVIAVGFAADGSGDDPAGPVLVPRLDLGMNPDHVLILIPGGERTVLLTQSGAAGPPARRSGLAGLWTPTVVLDPAALPAGETARWTGQAHQAALFSASRWWSLGTAAVALGAADAAMDHAAAYVSARHQFGEPLAAIPAVARTLREARLAIEELAAALARRAQDPAQTGDAELTRQITRTAVRLCLDAIQLFGGYGYLREFPVEGLLRDTISLRAAAAVVPPPVRHARPA